MQRRFEHLTEIDGYHLEPFTPQQHSEFVQRLRDPETWKPYNWFGFEYSAIPGGNLQQGTFGEGGVLAVINTKSAIVGQVQWIPGFWYGGANRHRGWNIGLIVLPEFRRTRATRAASTLLIDHLFTHTTANRLEATTPAEAVQFDNGLLSIGLVREGTMREAQWREGRWHDMAMLAILRRDWEQRSDERHEGGTAGRAPVSVSL